MIEVFLLSVLGVLGVILGLAIAVFGLFWFSCYVWLSAFTTGAGSVNSFPLRYHVVVGGGAVATMVFGAGLCFSISSWMVSI